ncbi:MAG: cytochrome c3 family protein [Candidatus Hydrogenedentes bacterium]|nr:cytochrome c3 family protein [Candidatus Hydrogenedentota bacterium]
MTYHATQRQVMYAAGAAALSLFLSACAGMTPGAAAAAKKQDRGVRVNHELHVAEGIACADCHNTADPAALFPTHDMCSTCHDIDMDNPDPQACGFCHTREDLGIDAWQTRIVEELKFTHDAHTSKGLECTACHGDNASKPVPYTAMKPWCMDCHGQTRPELNACNVCHKEMSRETRPKFNGTRRIAHDAPEVWEKIHGREALVDQKYCAICHENENFCSECHEVTPPRNHTINWRRATHGLEASWNRSNCSVCHEEDACLQCHQNTEPRSHHRAGWSGSRNAHCVECHYPAEDAGCTVCHENIDHRFALSSPHTLGIYPPDCSRCHPGGLPNQAPHLMNSTTQCVVCHQ